MVPFFMFESCNVGLGLDLMGSALALYARSPQLDPHYWENKSGSKHFLTSPTLSIPPWLLHPLGKPLCLLFLL